MCICAIWINIFEKSYNTFSPSEVTWVFFLTAIICVECYNMYREQAVRIHTLAHVCALVCTFGPFTLFESWSQKLVERTSVFNNKTRNQSTERGRGTNSTNQGTFCHIRLILHSLWNLREFPISPIQSRAMNVDKIGTTAKTACNID